jgi:hypothetical protein
MSHSIIEDYAMLVKSFAMEAFAMEGKQFAPPTHW